MSEIVAVDVAPPTDEELHGLSDEELQELIAKVVRAYAHASLRAGGLAPFASDELGAITATEAVPLASAILDAVKVELFEVELWRSWGGAS